MKRALYSMKRAPYHADFNGTVINRMRDAKCIYICIFYEKSPIFYEQSPIVFDEKNPTMYCHQL